jgi:hypothetical protein
LIIKKLLAALEKALYDCTPMTAAIVDAPVTKIPTVL